MDVKAAAAAKAKAKLAPRAAVTASASISSSVKAEVAASQIEGVAKIAAARAMPAASADAETSGAKSRQPRVRCWKACSRASSTAELPMAEKAVAKPAAAAPAPKKAVTASESASPELTTAQIAGAAYAPATTATERAAALAMATGMAVSGSSLPRNPNDLDDHEFHEFPHDSRAREKERPSSGRRRKTPYWSLNGPKPPWATRGLVRDT